MPKREQEHRGMDDAETSSWTIAPIAEALEFFARHA